MHKQGVKDVSVNLLASIRPSSMLSLVARSPYV